MRHYELVVVLSPMLNQEQASTAWGRIKDFITNRSAELDHEETWGTRRLAYAIKKGPYHFLEGSYHLTRFSADTPFNQELLTFLRLDEQVLRSLLTVTGPPQPIPEPAPVAQVAVAEQPADETVDTAQVWRKLWFRKLWLRKLWLRKLWLRKLWLPSRPLRRRQSPNPCQRR